MFMDVEIRRKVFFFFSPGVMAQWNVHCLLVNVYDSVTEIIVFLVTDSSCGIWDGKAVGTPDDSPRMGWLLVLLMGRLGVVAVVQGRHSRGPRLVVTDAASLRLLFSLVVLAPRSCHRCICDMWLLLRLRHHLAC